MEETTMNALSQIFDKIRNYDYNSLFNAVKKYAIKIGRTAAKPLVEVWLVLNSPLTSKEDKLWIGGMLAYLVLPIDIISVRRWPIIGLIDEALSIGVIYNKVKKYITPALEADADAILDKWFGPNPEGVAYQEIPVENE